MMAIGLAKLLPFPIPQVRALDRFVEVPHEAPDTAIEDLRRKLNEALVGERLDRVDTKLASLGERIAPGLRWLFDAIEHQDPARPQATYRVPA